MPVRSLLVARAQGAFNVLGGLWPLISMRSFEKVFGPKVDRWLVQVVAGLLLTAGWAQLRATPDHAGLSHARRLGAGCAATLAAIDLIYVRKGRISKAYLADAAAQGCWLLAWAASTRAADQPGPTT